MFADISLFTSLNSGCCTRYVKNSELLSYLKEYAEKSTGAMLCQQWLDSIRDRNDVTADLTARLSDASHDYDKEKTTAASKLKEQMMDESTQLDAEDNSYISSLEQGVQDQVKAMLRAAWENKVASMEAQLQQGAELQDLIGENGQVSPQPSPMTPPSVPSSPTAPAMPGPAPTAAVPQFDNSVSSEEY